MVTDSKGKDIVCDGRVIVPDPDDFDTYSKSFTGIVSAIMEKSGKVIVESEDGSIVVMMDSKEVELLE